MKDINVPSYKGLLGNVRQARALQDLYDYISRWKKEVDGSIEEINTTIDDTTHYKDVYIGEGDIYSDAMIESNHHDSLKVGTTTSVTATNKYLWVILPDDYTPTILMNGIVVPMVQQSNITVGNITYKVFKSDAEYTNTFNIILI